jgi:glycine/D-amino acid oxidase-like deaminating enzyme
VTVKTDAGDITADRALIACNAYIDGLEPVIGACDADPLVHRRHGAAGRRTAR